MSNGLEKDIIGEHEGWLNNPMLTFFVGLLLLSLFCILGKQFHVGARAESQDEIVRNERFQKIKEWRTNNTTDLSATTGIYQAKGDQKELVGFQIPLSVARDLVKEDLK